MVSNPSKQKEHRVRSEEGGNRVGALLREYVYLLEIAEEEGTLPPERGEDPQQAAQRHQALREECTQQKQREEELLTFFETEMAAEGGSGTASKWEREPYEWEIVWERFLATGSTGLKEEPPPRRPVKTTELVRAAQQLLIDLAQNRLSTTEALAYQELIAHLMPSRTHAAARARHLARLHQELSTEVDEEWDRLAPKIAWWDEVLATIERHGQRVEEEEPDRAQLSRWRQEWVQELIDMGFLEIAPYPERAET